MTLSRFRVSERQALHLIMVVSFAGFVAAIVVAVVRHHPPPAVVVKPPAVRWISPQLINSGNDIRHLVADLDDPSLMSLPDVRAFSQALWRHGAQIETQPLPVFNSVAYLDPSLPSEPSVLLRDAPLPEMVRADADKLVASVDEPVASEATVSFRQSVIQLDERLVRFCLRVSPTLPLIASETPLRCTRVRLAIGGDGTVLHAILDHSCGNDGADVLALDAARQLHFACPPDLASGQIAWGGVRFLWATKLP